MVQFASYLSLIFPRINGPIVSILLLLSLDKMHVKLFRYSSRHHLIPNPYLFFVGVRAQSCSFLDRMPITRSSP